MDYGKLSLEMHKKLKGKIEINPKIDIKTKKDLSIAYTPGIAEPCKEIKKNPLEYSKIVASANMVAVISDGSAVLGLGNLGPKPAMPVMEGKCVLFKKFGNIEAFPIVLDTQDTEEIIKTIKNIAPTFGGINLEDISAPRCFKIEERLKKELDIPVFHDDQHGTAIVVLAGLINALKITKKKKENLKVVINGVGAAGVAIGKLLHKFGIDDIVFCDSKGILSSKRNDLSKLKKTLIKYSKRVYRGDVHEAVKNADVFIGVSVGDVLDKKDISAMNKDAIIFALANPTPEIMPDKAKNAGAKIVATGRSDFPNQINNVLAFPGIFKGTLKAKCQITDAMKIEAAKAIAEMVPEPTPDKIIPDPFEKGIADAVAGAILRIAKN